MLHDRSIPDLRRAGIVGSANNQLADTRHARLIADHGALYAPDFVVNAGGIINIAVELEPGGYDEETAASRVDAIDETRASIFRNSERHGVTPPRRCQAASPGRIGGELVSAR